MKTHPSSAAAGAVVVALLPRPVERVSCMWQLSYIYASFLVSLAACGLVLSLDPPSEKKIYIYTILIIKYEEGKMN